MKCGLLGKKLGHSYSPQIHAHLGSYSYQLFEKQPEELEWFLRNGDFSGLNVTIPYKKAVIPFLDELSPCAQLLGAVNTIVKTAEGKLIGHNTDYFGFSCMLKRTGLDLRNKKVLVLGSGGASATVCAVLKEVNANVVVISRNGENHYGNLDRHADAVAIVNTTPVGMYPDVGVAPVDLGIFPLLEGVLDVIYNPARTQLLLDAEKRKITAENGLWMLIAQAKESAEWFAKCKISDAKIEKIHQQLSSQMKNIVLIGMPGCGKSTVGKILSERTGRLFVDADAAVAEYAGKSVPDIIEQSGEATFRSLETKILSDLGKQSGLVIATGGGCVTRPENYDLLHQNATIIWLQRDISILPTEGRPLSKQIDLKQLYQNRKDLYDYFADTTVNNDDSPEAIAARILEEGLIS